MRFPTTLTATAATAAGALALAVPAGADIGDIERVTIDNSLSGTATSVTVTGTIDCVDAIEFGLLIKVTQGPPDDDGPAGTTDNDSSDGDTTTNSASEGVGAFGPNFEGIQDDQPCGPGVTSWDAVIERNRGSGTFTNGLMVVDVLANTSAESGARGPGPFVGDFEFVDDDQPGVTFSR